MIKAKDRERYLTMQILATLSDLNNMALFLDNNRFSKAAEVLGARITLLRIMLGEMTRGDKAYEKTVISLDAEFKKLNEGAKAKTIEPMLISKKDAYFG